MNKKPAIKLLHCICVVAAFLFSQGFINTVFAQSQNLGDYKVELLPYWSYSGDKSSGDSFVFQNNSQKIEVTFKKEPTLCPTPMAFTQLILPIIQGFQKEQWIIEQRKPAAPYSFAGQKSCHFMKLKSKATGQQKFILNPLVKTKMYQIEITTESLLTDPPSEAINFISQVSTSDSPALAANKGATQSTADVNDPNVVISIVTQPETNTSGNEDLSGFTKVKAAPPSTQITKPAASNARPGTPSASSVITSPVSSPGTLPATSSVKPETPSASSLVTGVSSTGASSETGNTKQADQSTSASTPPTASSATTASGYDPAISDKAASIPDGDEQGSVINPIGTVNIVPDDANWAVGLAKDPKSLLDALEGGRPGGDVHALMALLRQTQGPFEEIEDQAMMKQYAPYAATASEKAHKGIRAQSELLLEAMIHRELMTQAAWEYDFAIAQNQLAELMQDEDEKEVTAMLAEIQRSIIQDQQTYLESIVKQAEIKAQIPTPQELAAEEQEERTNAETALGLENNTKNSNNPENRLVGYLKYEGTFIDVRKPVGYITGTPEQNGIVKVNGTNSVSFYQTSRTGMGYKPGTQEIWTDDVITSYECAWPTSGTIPIYANVTIYGDGSYDWYGGKVPFKVTIKDAGSKAHANKGVVSLVAGVGTTWSTAGGDKFSETRPDGEKNYCMYSSHIMIRVPESGEPYDSEYAPWGRGGYYLDGKISDVSIGKPAQGEYYFYINIADQTNYGVWTAYNRFKWEPVDLSSGVAAKPTQQDPSLSDEKNQAIAEHENNIAAAKKTIESIRREMAGEKEDKRREELRLQALHMEQNIHDSKDLIESIKTGTIVKTRGPWDEHSAIVLAETSRKMREEFQRASQMQASYVRMLKVLDKYNPDEAKKFRESMNNGVVKGIFDPGGFAKAQQALDALHASAKGASQAEQKKLEAQQGKAFERLEVAERNLRYVENLKSGCDKAIFVGTLFTGMGAGLALSMAYEGACTGVEKGPKEALKNMAIQGATMLAMAGVMKAGSWGIGKLLNPKVVKSEVNSFKNILEANKYQQEMEWNKALVNQLKEKTAAFEKCKATGGKNYLEVRKALDDAVSAANSSSLAKRIMKNELTVLENQIKSGATRDYTKLRECLNTQKIFDNRLQKSIYPRADAEMINKLRSQGYNVEKSWFQEYRNACSRGVNADRDLGLLAKFESQVTKNGQPVSMGQFMDEAQKVYDGSYKAITGRSAKLADQSITTSAHSESFPLSWLQKKMEGPFTTLDPPVTPQDFEKAGKAIYNKVQNALTGPDPAFVNMKKACASLSKDLKTKVLDRLKSTPANAGGSPASRQAALQHWEQVQKVMDDFATDKCDPLSTMKYLQQLTGSTSVSQSAAEVQKLLSKIGGA